ncbi:hypothetical protein ACQFN5_13545 [Klebsiella sp. WOUb02]|uniref:hypothetical protein n=1 Tax=Klebsiella sp. WOUb02 TaxID=3161071 RepID=UPI003CF9481C
MDEPRRRGKTCRRSVTSAVPAGRCLRFFAANPPLKNGYGQDGNHSPGAMVRLICRASHFIQAMNMKLRTIQGACFCLALALPLVSLASDDRNQPGSDLNDGVETFSISCFGMPQQTTIDINECMAKKLAQIGWVKDKYLTAAAKRIEQDGRDDPAHLQKTLSAFNDEGQAWDNLIDKASTAAGIDSEGGTRSGAMMALRQQELIELQVHDIWQHWLRFEDSTPPILPEPKFKFGE